MLGFEPTGEGCPVDQWHRALARAGIYTRGLFPANLANANPKGNETTAPAVSAKGGTINWYRTTPGKRLRVDSDDKAGAAELQHRLGRVFPEAVGAHIGWKGKKIPDQVKEWMKSKGFR